MAPNATVEHEAASGTNRPRRGLLLPFVGAATGAVFGVAFGAIASIFEGGPDLLTGIRESWWWFAAFGMFAGLLISFER